MPKLLNSAGVAALIFAAGLPASAFAQDAAKDTDLSELIVSATRADDGVKADLLGSSVTVISAQDMEDRQVRMITDVLRDIPGVSVSRAGPPGNFTQVRVRGAEANHLLLVIDGIEATDPYFGEPDYALLIADDTSRVELLRGPQSALYGSDAIAGVLNYSTPTGAQRPGVSARIEGGSFGTYDGAVRTAGVNGALDYALSAGYYRTEGYDATTNPAPGNRTVGGRFTNLSGKFSYKLTDAIKLKAAVRYSDNKGDANNQVGGIIINTPGRGYAATNIYGLVGADVSLLGGAWTHSIDFQGVESNRDTISAFVQKPSSFGSRIKGSYVSTYHFDVGSTRQSITGAVDSERETFLNKTPGAPAPFNQRQHIENTGFVLQYDLIANDRLGFGAAVRHDDNDRFQNFTSYRAEGSYRFGEGTRVHAAAGTGIKNPNYSELYGFAGATYVPNPNLDPEKSVGWEAGVSQKLWGQKAQIDVTYFKATLEGEISLDCAAYPLCSPINLATRSHQQGVEVSGQVRLADAWTVNAAYTWLDADQNGAVEIRRPKDIASLTVNWKAPGSPFGANVAIRYNGDNPDTNFATFSAVVIPAFTLVNVGGTWDINDKVQLFGRVENLFDETYQEIYSYRGQPRGAYVGLRARF
jgi:vitamin B12 transporter